MFLSKYTVDHQAIRRALKIPPTTFCRLRRESTEPSESRDTIKCRRNSRAFPEQEQKVYIDILVKLQPSRSLLMIFKDFIDKVLDLNTQVQDIRSFIIKELRFRFKRECNRPIISKKKKCLWALFPIRLFFVICKNC